MKKDRNEKIAFKADAKTRRLPIGPTEVFGFGGLN